MTPNELYKLPPISVFNDHWLLESHVDEVDFFCFPDVNIPGLEIRTYADHSFDGDRCWTLASVWFNGKPFMVIQNGGRGGKDHGERFVTDQSLYYEFVAVCQKLIGKKEVGDLVNPDQDYPSLTSFYNCDLSQFYDPKLTSPKYKVNDLLLVRVLENHVRDMYRPNKVKIVVRVRVTNVKPLVKAGTYHGKQIDRRWPRQIELGQYSKVNPVIDPNKGDLYASFDDEDVIGYANPEELP